MMAHLIIQIDHARIPNPLLESNLRIMILGGMEILVSVSHPDYSSTDQNIVEKQKPTEKINKALKFLT